MSASVRRDSPIAPGEHLDSPETAAQAFAKGRIRKRDTAPGQAAIFGDEVLEIPSPCSTDARRTQHVDDEVVSGWYYGHWRGCTSQNAGVYSNRVPEVTLWASIKNGSRRILATNPLRPFKKYQNNQSKQGS